MDVPNPTLPILKNIGTTEEAAEFVEYIDKAIAGMYQADRAQLMTALDTMLPETISKEIKDYLNMTNISLTNHEEVRVALTKLQADIRATEVASLTLAVSPTKKMLQGITRALKERFGDTVIAEISVNPAIVGGALVIFRGSYADQSVKRKLDILFDAKKDEILKLIQ